MNKKSKTKLTVNNFVKVMITDKRINMNDSQIKALGKLLDIATENEVEKYYSIKTMIEKGKGTSNKFNADCDIVESEPESDNNFII
jgi:type 1 glutamine amidotransferase